VSWIEFGASGNGIQWVGTTDTKPADPKLLIQLKAMSEYPIITTEGPRGINMSPKKEPASITRSSLYQSPISHLRRPYKNNRVKDLRPPFGTNRHMLGNPASPKMRLARLVGSRIFVCSVVATANPVSTRRLAGHSDRWHTASRMQAGWSNPRAWMNLDAQGSLPKHASSSQPIVRLRGRGSLPRLPFLCVVTTEVLIACGIWALSDQLRGLLAQRDIEAPCVSEDNTATICSLSVSPLDGLTV
jgi:hypothetical protein